jgi:hypothetical protein
MVRPIIGKYYTDEYGRTMQYIGNSSNKYYIYVWKNPLNVKIAIRRLVNSPHYTYTLATTDEPVTDDEYDSDQY